MHRGYALYLSVLSVLATLAATGFVLEASPTPLAPRADEPAAPVAGSEQEDPMRGLWSRWPDRQREGDPVRFYYFHGDGHGLYRYGRVGFTNTHSFDYQREGDVLVLKFRKSGEQHRLRYAVEVGRDGRRVLHLKGDPEEDGKSTDYFYVPAPLESHAFVRASDAKKPTGRMWIDLTKFATGGAGFSMYQLGPAGIDGRGTGWHHRGDFDDWSTESLTYRIEPDTLELRFDLTQERFATRYGVVMGEDGKRRLVLHQDPRNWWHRAVFTDMGRSFAAGLSLPSSPAAGL